MLLSVPGLSFVLLGRMPDVKAIQTAIKILKVGDWSQVDESRMRTLSNWMVGESRPGISTFNRTMQYFQSLADCFGYEMPREFSAFKYEDFFKADESLSAEEKWRLMRMEFEMALSVYGLSDHFFAGEIRSILAALTAVSARDVKPYDAMDFEREMMSDGILSIAGMMDGLMVTIHTTYEDPFHGLKSQEFIFSLNLMLYLQACLDVETEFQMQVFFERFLDTPDIDKPPMHHYAEMLKTLMTKNKGKLASWSEVTEALDISDEKVLRRYRDGKYPVREGVIARMLEISGGLYPCIHFWVNLVKILIKNNVAFPRIARELARYPHYLEIAQRRQKEGRATR